MERILRSISILGGGVVAAGITAEFFLYDVDAGTRAVIFDKISGVQEKVVGEGTHFRIPFIQVNPPFLSSSL
jgi:prohibitin 1